MKHFIYLILGGVIGLFFGVIFGFIFDTMYTKKSELATKQSIQVIIFGGLGTIAGASLGAKIASEEKEKRKKELEYQKSLIETKCNFCNDSFKYSSLEFTNKKYCDSCITKIKRDYVSKCLEINSIVKGIEELKRHSAINKRLDRVAEIAKSLEPYENIDLDFISKKPSEILESTIEYRLKLI